jgi:hypothetical protein
MIGKEGFISHSLLNKKKELLILYTTTRMSWLKGARVSWKIQFYNLRSKKLTNLLIWSYINQISN